MQAQLPLTGRKESYGDQVHSQCGGGDRVRVEVGVGEVDDTS